MPTKLPKEGEILKDNIYYKGWKIENFKIEAGNYQFDEPVKLKGWIARRRKTVAERMDERIFKNYKPLFISKDSLDEHIHKIRSKSFDNIVEIINNSKVDNSKVDNTTSNQVKIPEELLTNAEYLKVLSSEVFFDKHGYVFEDCFDNSPKEKNLAFLLNFDKKKSINLKVKKEIKGYM